MNLITSPLVYVQVKGISSITQKTTVCLKKTLRPDRNGKKYVHSKTFQIGTLPLLLEYSDSADVKTDLVSIRAGF